MNFLRYCVNVSGRKCLPPNIAIDAAMTPNCMAIQCALGSPDIDYGGSCSFWKLRNGLIPMEISFGSTYLITSHWLMNPDFVGVLIFMRLILFLFFIASKIARTCHHHPTGCAGVDSEARLNSSSLQDSFDPRSALYWVRRLAFCLVEWSWRKHVVTVLKRVGILKIEE